jgi:kelch-like protein 9/13
MWRAGELCDFKVMVDGVQFMCHKLVLASCSAYFRALLQGDRFADSSTQMSLEEMSSSTFSQVLSFVYEGVERRRVHGGGSGAAAVARGSGAAAND